jgi:tRNA acetyltransferase TAN1
MSVVGSDWEKLKRFNLAELYPSASRTQPGAEFKAEAVPAMPESVTTDETHRARVTAAEGPSGERMESTSMAVSRGNK